MNDNTPGSPAPETPKPSIKEASKPSFSYFDLSFEDAFTINGKKFVSYFVDGKHPYYIQVLRTAFEDYQKTFWDKFDFQAENDLCTCDNCEPDFQFIDEIVLELYEKVGDDKDNIVKKQVFPVYNIFNLSSSFKIGTNTCQV
jgi:hypothetical protein